MTPISLNVFPERRDFMQSPAPVDNGDGPVIDTDGHGAAEQLLYLLRTSGRGEIEIFVLEVEQVVSHGTAHAPRLMPRPLERLGNAENFVRDA